MAWRKALASDDAAAQLACILNSIPHIIWSCGPDGATDFISDQWSHHYDGDRSELLGSGWMNFVHPDDLDEAIATWNSAVATCEPYQSRFRLRLPHGEFRWVIAAARLERETDGKPVRWFGTCTDIHEPVLMKDELIAKERLHRSILEASADCIKVISAEGRVQLMNEPGLRLMELPDVAAISDGFWWDHWPIATRSTVKDAIEKAGRGEVVRFEGMCPTASGTPKWWDVVVTPIRNDSGDVGRLLAISRDCSADREKSKQLAWTSEHDALTALPNRRAFQARLQAAALRSMASESKVGLLLIDLDHFKHVNDTLGHPAGDALLQKYAKRLSSAMRSQDFVARIGGDEFAVIVEGISLADDLLRIGQKIVAELKAPVRIEGRSISGGASIGGALFPDDAPNASDLFKLADTALYALKADGRGGTKLFHAHMREEAQRVASQLNLARDVARTGRVCPFYQPKSDLRTGALVGFEALLRWRNRSGVAQLPETIEEAFKDYELASSIGALMQDAVLSDIAKWAKAGMQFGRVSINAAPVEFLRDDFAERLLERISRHGVSPAMIEVEVTEHVLLANGSQSVCRALSALKETGVSIALDDFGTGYSSLSHLRDFPVDIVKIDKSFVQKVGSDTEIAAIVAAVVNLARSLNIRTVAEGLESEEQVKLLRAAGCDFGQGFILGRPTGAEDALKYLESDPVKPRVFV
jgi:diguanylate cyclase (GGDEF)-like protein/PAS domain S-box-containing protein